MRLIDADCFEVVGWQATGNEPYDEGFTDGAIYVGNKIDNAPTIDAIPVEWIEAHMTPAMAHFASRAKELLLEAWQKEQEENDG